MLDSSKKAVVLGYIAIIIAGCAWMRDVHAQPAVLWQAQASSLEHATVRPYMVRGGGQGIHVIGSSVYETLFSPLLSDPDSSFAFVAQLDDSGNYTRVSQGILPNGSAFCIALDAAGAAYVLEGYQYAFDSKMWTEGSVIVNKYAPDGALEWSLPFGAYEKVRDFEMAPVFLKGIGVDDLGNIYVAGEFRGTLEIEGETYYSESVDLIVASFDAQGKLRWFDQVEGPGFDIMAGVLRSPIGILAVSGSGGVFLGGRFEKGATFSSGHESEYTLGAVSPTYAIAHYASDGTVQWVRTPKQIGVTGDVGLLRATVDDEHNLTLAWFMAGSPTVAEAEVDGIILRDPGYGGTFVTQHTESGTLNWVNQLESDGNEWVTDLVSGAAGQVHISGHFDGLYLDAGGGNVVRKNDLQEDREDGFVVSYNSDGVPQRILHARGPHIQRIRSIDANANGDLHVTGEFWETLKMPDLSLSARGKADLFVATYTAEQITSREYSPSHEAKPLAVAAYPNPFSRTITVSVELVTSQAIQVDIYDTLGRKVANLAHGRFSAGLHRFEFSGIGLASGIYIARIQRDAAFAVARTLVKY
ncbi:MAG: hypothetical protein RhofKO_31810 [Rhodothermales bacterium]